MPMWPGRGAALGSAIMGLGSLTQSSIIPVGEFDAPRQISREEVYGILGEPTRPDIAIDRIVSDIIVQPFLGPLDLGNYSQETWQDRADYRYQFRAQPVMRAAMLGKIAAVSCLDPNVLPENDDSWKGDRKRAELAKETADFVNWTIGQAAGGWLKLIEDVYGGGIVDGWSVCAKKLKDNVRWRRRMLWGFDHTRQLDTGLIRLQLDVYRNPIAIVNMIRGLEYYSPEQVILYAHNPMYCSPFGVSDGRGAIQAGNVIQDAYAVWLVACKVYGLPYMTGKYSDATRKHALAQALEALRGGGWAVTHKDDEIDVLNAAVGVGDGLLDGLIHRRREDIFFNVRGSPQPSMEGKGGENAHTDTKEQKKGNDQIVYHDELKVANCIQQQLFKDLVVPNFGPDAPIPILSLGGVDWEETNKVVDTIEKLKKLGYQPKEEWIQKVVSVPFEEDGSEGAPDEQDNTATVQAVLSVQEAFTAGTLSQPAAIALVMTFMDLDYQTATSLFPTVKAVKRIDEGQQPGGGMPGQPPPGGQPQQASPPTGPMAQPAAEPAPQPSTFSDAHDPAWKREADALIAKWKGLT